MASFKINIGDPKTAKCFKTEVKDQQAASFIGLNIGEKIDGNKIGINGYEFLITGGTDKSGFPMRRGILGERKRIVMYHGLGFRGGLKGMKKRKTVCGHKINNKISAINLKVVKEGTKKLVEIFGQKEEKTEEKPKAEHKKEEKQSKQEIKDETKKNVEEKKRSKEEKIDQKTVGETENREVNKESKEIDKQKKETKEEKK